MFFASKQYLQYFRSKPWKSVVGLEIHAQINTESKLFSGAENKFGGPTNTQVSLFDAAFPGTLPVLNKGCVEAGVLTALALRCTVNKVSKFDRKHYFYADLPAGYQITQQRQPLAVKGHVDYCISDKNSFETKTANITQIQLEQDSGKSLHDEKDRISLIDLNRCGTGLMEIVTEPDFSDGTDASAFVKELQKILQTIQTCDCKMEEGSLRVDANISVHKPENHLVYGQNETVPMRDKEVKTDYRFMPEPNLPPLHLFDSESVKTVSSKMSVINIDDIQQKLPPLPEDTRKRLEQQYSLKRRDVAVLVDNSGLVDYFEDVMRLSPTTSAKLVSNFIINQLLGVLNDRKLTIYKCPVKTEDFGKLIDLLHTEEISYSTSCKVLDEMFEHPNIAPEDIVDQKDWRQISDTQVLTNICEKVLEEHPKLISKYRKGKLKYLHTLVNKAVIDSNNKANPRILKQIMEDLLDNK
ncbi:PET112 [Mytilus edulis]|uniref:Glutamyl-tRNA(Gln) amidotransferase subunit B, mitochondrial n=1 Tax=Mytilus edulis TaxID=6550 RepID=A0A8S3QJ47_MYTED|nr:PET112 [Mytilus edulis]